MWPLLLRSSVAMIGEGGWGFELQITILCRATSSILRPYLGQRTTLHIHVSLFYPRVLSYYWQLWSHLNAHVNNHTWSPCIGRIGVYFPWDFPALWTCTLHVIVSHSDYWKIFRLINDKSMSSISLLILGDICLCELLVLLVATKQTMSIKESLYKMQESSRQRQHWRKCIDVEVGNGIKLYYNVSALDHEMGLWGCQGTSRPALAADCT